MSAPLLVKVRRCLHRRYFLVNYLDFIIGYNEKEARARELPTKTAETQVICHHSSPWLVSNTQSDPPTAGD